MSAAEKKSTGLVGFFLFIGLIVLGVLIVQFGRFGDRFSGRYPLYVEFNSANGVVKGCDVRMQGAKIGSVVTKPVFNKEHMVEIELRISPEIQIPKGSMFQIEPVTLLGDKVISVVPPVTPTTSYIEPGARLTGAGAGGMDAIQNDAASVARDARVLMKDARTALLKVDAALDDFRALAGRVTNTVEKVNGKMLSEGNIKKISNVLTNMEEASKSISDTGKELKPTMEEVRKSIASINKAAKSAEETFAKASAQIENLEPALKGVPETLKSLREASSKATVLMDKIGGVVDESKKAVASLNNNNGLLKTLTNDKEMKDDTKSFVKNLRLYGILRYRDDRTEKEKSPRDRYRGSRR